MRIASTIGASKVVHDGEEYEADESGILEVPQHVGEELTGFPAWVPEHVAAAQAAAEQSERDTDAQRQADRIAALEARVDALEAALAPADKPDAKTKTTK